MQPALVYISCETHPEQLRDCFSHVSHCKHEKEEAEASLETYVRTKKAEEKLN